MAMTVRVTPWCLKLGHCMHNKRSAHAGSGWARLCKTGCWRKATAPPSAYPKEAARSRALTAGAVAFLSKPFEESALISPLETAVKRWESFQRYSVATVL